LNDDEWVEVMRWEGEQRVGWARRGPSQLIACILLPRLRRLDERAQTVHENEKTRVSFKLASYTNG
jgi:hypothetical protein